MVVEISGDPGDPGVHGTTYFLLESDDGIVVIFCCIKGEVDEILHQGPFLNPTL